MKVYGVDIASNRGLTNLEIYEYVKKLNIPNFRGVFMRDTLPNHPKQVECAIVNLNTSKELGSHWVCYVKKGKSRIYFDSFGQVIPLEIEKYLKTSTELQKHIPVIARNTDIVQSVNTHVCGHLCLFVLASLTRQHLSYQQVLNLLNDGYTQTYW